MKVLINLFITFAIIFIIGCEPNNSATEAIKAKSGDQVLTVLNHIKFDKKQEFNTILFNEVMPAYSAYTDSSAEKNILNDMADKAMRMLLPINMNEDSTWTFVMFADPYYEGALYNIIPPLKQKYGEEGAEEVFSRWSDCFAEGQEIYLSKQN
tara:strand:- start:36 stop:494 length:459 start_codon:yes stop_codon:yes gene_type:complete